jgi:transcriptional regulator with XRE-family HTH domain
MTSLKDLGDDAVLKALGARLARRRLDGDYTQQQLAERAGVGRRAVQRLEGGDPVTTVALTRVLRALDALAELDAGIPELGPSPLQALAREGRVRQRASGQSSKPAAAPGEFRWGRSS